MNNAGYIALTSAIIVSVIVMAVTFSAGLSGAFNRFNALSAMDKEASGALAESCIGVALLRLAQDSGYGGDETIPIASTTCAILPIETAIGQKTVKARGTVQGSVTNIRAVVRTSDLLIQSWSELPAF